MLRRTSKRIVWGLGILLLVANAAAWAGPGLLFPEDRRHIALDPGHGGDDVGARGPTGALEKNVCLELARTLALRLEARYRVTLTRSDDYHVELPQRAAIANHAKAHLFISLHVGASFQHASRGMIIYYHSLSPERTDRPMNRLDDSARPVPWSEVQTRHQSSSLALANALKPHLARHYDAADIRIVKAPLAPLEGVDMPAVLIELGHITNPAMEQHMASSQGAASFARALEAGINAYLQTQSEDRP